MTNAIHRRILAFALAVATVIAFTPAIAFTQSASAATRPGKVQWSSITKTPTTITLKWKKASKAKGYSVYQKKSGKYKKIKTTTKRTYTTKKLKAFKSYSFKVRAYRMSGGKKVYGKYSSAKKVTTAASKITGVTITSSASSVSAGSNVTFTATVTGGTKPLKYQWYKDGVLIEGATDSTYTATLSSSDSGAKFTCKVTGPDGKSLTSEEAGSVTVYNTVTRTVVKSWNIGNKTVLPVNYDGSNGTSDVVATLYSDGELAVTGSGDTVVFGDPGNTGGTPWAVATYKTQVKSSTIASTVKPTNMGHWYEGCAITAAPTIPSSVTNMNSTFQGCTSLTTAPDLSGCTNLGNMIETFSGCSALTTAPTIPNSVWDMSLTFHGCTALTTAPTIPSSVTYMGYTFEGCVALTGTMLIKANISNSDNYDKCFYNASTNSTASLKVYGLDTTNDATVDAIVTDTNTNSPSSHITYGGYKVASWNIGSDTTKNNYTGSNGTDKVVAALYSNGELAVTGSGDTVVFGDATSGTEAYKTPWNLDGKTKDVKSATIASGVTPTNMGHWYEGCAITAAPAIPSSVTEMDSTFEDCTSLTTAPDLSGCTQLTNMHQTFAGCTALTTAPTIPSSVTDMTSTFSSCIALTGTMLIKTNTTNYNGCFAFVAINSGTNLKVNYTSTSESFVNAIISTCGPSGTFSRGNITKAFTYVDVDDQTASSGTATFTAAVDATVTITSYQWQKSTDGGKTFADVTGATSKDLSLTGLKTSDNGNIYRCVVSNGSSTAYGEGTLTVN